jgi:hypothetical protein
VPAYARAAGTARVLVQHLHAEEQVEANQRARVLCEPARVDAPHRPDLRDQIHRTDVQDAPRHDRLAGCIFLPQRREERRRVLPEVDHAVVVDVLEAFETEASPARAGE